MEPLLNTSFFRFTFGFLAILGLSFTITFAVDRYAQYETMAQEAAAFLGIGH